MIMKLCLLKHKNYFRNTQQKVRILAEKLRQAKAQILRMKHICEEKDQVISHLELSNNDLLQRIEFLNEK